MTTPLGATPVPQRITLLHTNDIHARVVGIARIATLVASERAAQPETPTLYFDLGDVEDTANRLSSLTKGAAMHRLLSAAGCDASAVGNAVLMRYGPTALRAEAAVASYPLLLANLRDADGEPLAGTTPHAMLTVGGVRLGLIGLTAVLPEYETFLGLQTLPVLPLVRELVASLRQDGADAVLLLSHMGLDVDRRLASELQSEVLLILGAHTHDLLPEGERIGSVTLAQAGQYAEHVGRVTLLWDGETLSVEAVRVLPVPEETPQSPAVLAVIDVVEAEIAASLADVVGELATPLDFSPERECGVGDLAADALRAYMRGDVGLAMLGGSFDGPLPAGPLRRGMLWEASSSTANPALATLTGAQLAEIVARGLDPTLAAERPRAMRGQAMGTVHLSGASIRGGILYIGDQPLDPTREYLVAATDFELGGFFGYTNPEWQLRVTYDPSVIVREVVADYLQKAPKPTVVPTDRIDATVPFVAPTA